MVPPQIVGISFYSRNLEIMYSDFQEWFVFGFLKLVFAVLQSEILITEDRPRRQNHYHLELWMVLREH